MGVMNKSILLASFVRKDELYSAIDKISEQCNIDTNKVFVFINENNLDEYILTYNMSTEFANTKFNSIWENTISVHRKKNTNTLYSINALNELIKMSNNGYLDKHFKIDWSKYQNSFLTIKSGKLKVIPIRLIKVNR